VAPKLRDRIGDLAEVASVGASLDFGAMVDDLGERGVRQLMVEGGTTIHTQFLTADLADEIHLAVAPFFVGDADAPRFMLPGNFPRFLRSFIFITLGGVIIATISAALGAAVS